MYFKSSNQENIFQFTPLSQEVRKKVEQSFGTMFTLGDVADILDNALDMGINIVEALHKLAEAGDKGQVSKDECLSQLEFSGEMVEGDRNGSPTPPRRKRAANSLSIHEDGPRPSVFPEKSQVPSYEDFPPVREMQNQVKVDSSYNWEEITSYVTVQDLDRESWSKRLHGWNENEISPLRLSSSNVRLEEMNKEYVENEMFDTDVDYCGAPLKRFVSKRWSNTFELHMADDNVSPQTTGKVSNSASRQSSFGGENEYLSGQAYDKNYDSEDEIYEVKRPRRNTYSIESTPVSEAEERGLPIIDVLDDLCAMADQFMDVEWIKVEESAQSNIYIEKNYELSGSEDEVPAIASKSTDEKIIALDNETARAYRSFTDAMQTEDGVCDADEFDGKTSGRVVDASSLDQIVDQKIADIGSQAEIVLESFKSLKQLRQYEKQQSDNEFEGAQSIVNKDFVDDGDANNSHFDLQRGAYIIQEKPSDGKADLNVLSFASRTCDGKQIDHVNGFEKVEIQTFGENNRFGVVYSTVEEVVPYEFKTIADVTFDYTQGEKISSNQSQISSSKSNSGNFTERKRPGTYLIENSREREINSVYEEPVFITSKESISNLKPKVDASQSITSEDSKDLNIKNREKGLDPAEISITNSGNDFLKNSHTSCDKQELSSSSVKAVRPGTYVLKVASQNVDNPLVENNDSMKGECDERTGIEETPSHSQFQHGNGSKRRPGTFVLGNYNGSNVLEHNSEKEIDAEPVMEKQSEPNLTVSHDTVTVKKRPCTYVLEKSTLSFPTETYHSPLSQYSERVSADVSSTYVNPEIFNEISIPESHIFESEEKPIEDGSSEIDRTTPSVEVEEKELEMDATTTDENIPSGQKTIDDTGDILQYSASDNAILVEKKVPSGCKYDKIYRNGHEDTIKAKAGEDRIYKNNDNICDGGGKKLGRPSTYILTRPSLNHDSLCVTKSGTLSEGSEIEYTEKPALEQTSEHVQSRPRKPRPGTFILDTAMTTGSGATDETEGKVKTVENDPINDSKGAGDTVIETRDHVVSKHLENEQDQVIKRNVRVRKPRPSTYLVNRALSRVLRASGGLSTEEDICSSSDKGAESNASKDKYYSALPDNTSKFAEESPAPQLKVAPDVAMLDLESNTDGEEFNRESKIFEENHNVNKLESRVSKAEVTPNNAVDSEEALEVRQCSSSYVWKVSERTVISDSRCLENTGNELTESSLHSIYSKQEPTKSSKNEYSLSLKEDLLPSESENATDSFREPAKEETVRNLRECTVVGDSSELSEKERNDNAMQTMSVEKCLADNFSYSKSQGEDTQSALVEVASVKADSAVEGSCHVDFGSVQDSQNKAQSFIDNFSYSKSQSEDTQSALVEFTNGKADSAVEGSCHVDFGSVQDSQNKAQPFIEMSVKNRNVCDSTLETRSEKQNVESIEREIGIDKSKDLTTEPGVFIGSSEKRSDMAMNHSEMNNNDVRTVERDFSYKSDYGEMADECTVLSTFVENDCCPDERFDNEAAGIHLSKEPVIARENDLANSQRCGSAKAKTVNPNAGYTLKQDSTENTGTKANSSSTFPESKADIVSPLELAICHARDDEECSKRTINESSRNPESGNLNTESLKTNINETVVDKYELVNAKSEKDDEMKGGRIAVKLEINFADSYENSGVSSRKRGTFAGKHEGRDAETGQGKNEDLGEEDIDSRNGEDDRVSFKLQIDDSESSGGGLSRRSSQGISFDIDLDDRQKKTVRSPVDSKHRLSLKTPSRRRTTDRPGTYVLNSPVFSRDEYEDEGELQERFGRRSLGSSDGGDLEYEIKRAVEQGRLELNYDSPEDDDICEKGDANIHVRKNLHAKSSTNGHLEQPVENLRGKSAIDETKISKESLGTEFNNETRKDSSSSHGVKVEDVRQSVEVNDESDVDCRKSKEVVLRSKERLPRTGTYVLRVLEPGKNDMESDGNRTFYPGIDRDENDDGTEEEEVVTRFWKSSPRQEACMSQGSDDTIELKRNGESKAQPVAPSLSPRMDKKGRKSTRIIEKDSVKERFEKFRKSFDKQRIGFFVDLNSGDANLEKKHTKQSDSPKERREGLNANIVESLAENVDVEDKTATDLAFLKPKNGARGLSSEVNTVPNVCIYDQKIDSMPAFNYSTAQLKDCKISSQDHNEDYYLVKSSKQGIDKVLDDRNTSNNRELGPEDSMTGMNSLLSPRSGQVVCISSEFRENIIHRRSFSLPVENERKLRYSSWDITPDTEKEVLGKITSLKECPSSHSTGDDTVEGLDATDATVAQANFQTANMDFEEDKGYSSEFQINPMESFNRNGDIRSCDTSEQYEARKEKKSTEKSEKHIYGKKVNEEEVKSYKEETGKEGLELENAHDGAVIKRKNTFRIERVDDSGQSLMEESKGVLTVESSKAPLISYSRDSHKYEENLDSTADISSEVDFHESKMRLDYIQQNESFKAPEISHTEDSLKFSKVTGFSDSDFKKRDLAMKSSRLSNDIDAGIASMDSLAERRCNDEAIVEDFDLYVSNGSRPASGTSESQPVNERRHSDDIGSLASSVISSGEDLELEDVRSPKDAVFTPSTYPFTQQPLERRGKVFDRQLSDTIVALSRRRTSANDENDIARSYDETRQEAVKQIGRQLSENIMETKADSQGVEKHLANHRTLASLTSPDNELRVSPIKVIRGDKRQNFGHRPMSYDVVRKPLLERLERLCTFMSKSLTKLNSMGEGESEIVSKLDKVHGREDLFLRRKGSSSSHTGQDSVPFIDENVEQEKVHSGMTLSSCQESNESDDEDRSESDGSSKVKLREPKSGTNRGQTYVIQRKESVEPERTGNETKISASVDSGCDLNFPIGANPSQPVQWKAQRKRGVYNMKELESSPLNVVSFLGLMMR